MVGERKVVDAAVHLRVGVAGTLGAELPYRPIVVMFRVEELYEPVEGIPICALGVGLRRAGTREKKEGECQL